MLGLKSVIEKIERFFHQDNRMKGGFLGDMMVEIGLVNRSHMNEVAHMRNIEALEGIKKDFAKNKDFAENLLELEKDLTKDPRNPPILFDAVAHAGFDVKDIPRTTKIGDLIKSEGLASADAVELTNAVQANDRMELWGKMLEKKRFGGVRINPGGLKMAIAADSYPEDISNPPNIDWLSKVPEPTKSMQAVAAVAKQLGAAVIHAREAGIQLEKNQNIAEAFDAMQKFANAQKKVLSDGFKDISNDLKLDAKAYKGDGRRALMKHAKAVDDAAHLMKIEYNPSKSFANPENGNVLKGKIVEGLKSAYAVMERNPNIQFDSNKTQKWLAGATKNMGMKHMSSAMERGQKSQSRDKKSGSFRDKVRQQRKDRGMELEGRV